ncbi:PD40 domain-containing protein, partial [Candidatus Woesearchaeota archaeon]|nr:PD40 domain-containing protein [Candidatus Woesearchaeota archaeon]
NGNYVNCTAPLPGAEICDGLDNNCNGAVDEGLLFTMGYLDDDGDGFGSSTFKVDCKELGDGYATKSGDCNDNNPEQWQGLLGYVDADKDGYGTGSLTMVCSGDSLPAGFASNATDCNNGNNAISPGALEICDGLDNDCNTATYDGSSQIAPFNLLQAGICSGSRQQCMDGAWQSWYGGVAGYEAVEGSCDGIDNDCDKETDEGLLSIWYLDNDGDGFGDAATYSTSCTPTGNYVSNADDCDDTQSSVHPAGKELCDLIDNNCDGKIDDGCLTKIVFTSLRDGNSEIYTMNSDGSNPVRLTNNPAQDSNASWSPNGKQIAFETQRDGNAEIYVMNADGTGQVNITKDGRDDRYPAWSPDGMRIAFYYSTWAIATMDIDGGNQTKLTASFPYRYAPDWSPEGSKIVHTQESPPNSEIYVMDSTGGNEKQLTSNPAVDGGAAWSPDGTTIAFYSNRDGNFEIYTMATDGSALKNLTQHAANDEKPSWSGNSSKIVFVSNRDGDSEIYIMNDDGSGVQRLTYSTGDDNDPDW